MPTNRLTDNQCRLAKPREKAYKLFDGGGLFLWVSASGAKTWRQAYRVHGKPQTASHGDYPLVTLADARAKRDALKKTLLNGERPTKKIKSSLTLQQASDTFWDGRKDITDGYRSNAKRGIELHLTRLLNRPIASITRDDLLDELNALDAKGRHVYVRRVRVWVGLVFEWAIEQRHASSNPAAAINPEKAFKKAEVKHHAALELSEIPDLWERVALEDELISVLAMKFMSYTWTRTGEIRFMKWSEIDGDLWRIPKGRMKKKRDHLVPLNRQALDVLAKMKARSRGSDYVFPAEHRLDRPMSENTVLMLLKRLGYQGRMTGHGWRSVASTWANENGFNPDAVEMQLAHWKKDVRAVYNRAAYLPERKKMLQAWADWLTDIDASRTKRRKTPAHRLVA